MAVAQYRARRRELTSQTCAHCGADVAADEQFCTNCGHFINPMEPTRPAVTGSVISVTSDGNYEEFQLEGEPPADGETGEAAPPTTGRTVGCPSCGAINPTGNRHCQECGARLNQGPLPTAPRPAVQATAGVRAALAISGLLFLVIIVALLFNVFGGEEATPTSIAESTTTTQVVIVQPDRVDILNTECIPAGLGAFTCSNLTSGTTGEYQVNWEELVEGESIVIKLTFREPIVVTRIDWTNLTNVDRFNQNYRARGISINADSSVTAFRVELQDLPGTQNVDFAAFNTNFIEITIESAYLAEVVDGNSFREIAIDEITVIGRPANPTTNTNG